MEKTERVSIRKGHIPSPRGEEPQKEGGFSIKVNNMPFEMAQASPVKGQRGDLMVDEENKEDTIKPTNEPYNIGE